MILLEVLQNFILTREIMLIFSSINRILDINLLVKMTLSLNVWWEYWNWTFFNLQNTWKNLVSAVLLFSINFDIFCDLSFDDPCERFLSCLYVNLQLVNILLKLSDSKKLLLILFFSFGNKHLQLLYLAREIYNYSF